VNAKKVKISGGQKANYETAATRANQRKNLRRQLGGLHRSPQLFRFEQGDLRPFQTPFSATSRGRHRTRRANFRRNRHQFRKQNNRDRTAFDQPFNEDVGRLVKVDDWARDLLPDRGDSFYKFLAKKRGQIEAEQVPGESELLGAFNLSEKDRAAVKAFLCFPLENSAHAGALLISHNSFAV